MNRIQTIRALQAITRLIVGGAQETVMLIASLLDPESFDVEVISGPQTGPEGSLIDQVRERNIPLTVEPTLVREINPLKDLQALIRLTRFIKNGRFQIVHTNSSKAGILGRFAAWLAGTPVVVHTVHGWGHHDRQHPLVRRSYILLERLALRVTDRLVVVSAENIEKGLSDGIGRREDYVVIRSGIELDRFGHPLVSGEETRAALGIPADAPVVGTVTRLSPQKSPLDFIRAASRVAAEMPDVCFLIVGDGPLKDDVASLIHELDIADRVLMTGLRRDVPELLAAMDVFVLTSLWEGLPRVIPQAMAAGLPIVATAVDGNMEAVSHGTNGLLVPPREPDALATEVLRLLTDQELARKLAAVGKKGVHEYSDRRMVAQITDLYLDLLRQKEPVARSR